ncbi:putative reverse transcriptase domain-containing protein [Tanacetum coccineum]
MPWAATEENVTVNTARGVRSERLRTEMWNSRRDLDKVEKYIGGLPRYDNWQCKKGKERMMIFPRTIKTNRIRGRTQARPTLQATVKRNHTPGLNLCVPGVIAIMKQVLVHLGVVTVIGLAIWPGTVGYGLPTTTTTTTTTTATTTTTTTTTTTVTTITIISRAMGSSEWLWVRNLAGAIPRQRRCGISFFLAHVTAKEVEGKSEMKRLEDVIQLFKTSEVFPEDLRVKFVWGDKQEAAFQLLKQKLCSAPILALPEGSEDFISITCDGFRRVWCAVLLQRGKGVSYALPPVENS